MGKAFCQLNVGFCTPRHQTPAMSRKLRSAGFCDWSRCRTALVNHRQSESIGLMRFQKHRQSVSFSDTALAFAFERELVESGEYQNISAAVSVEMDRARAARDRGWVLCKTPVQSSASRCHLMLGSRLAHPTVSLRMHDRTWPDTRSWVAAPPAGAYRPPPFGQARPAGTGRPYPRDNAR